VIPFRVWSLPVSLPSLATLETIASLVQAVVTMGAIVAAAYWFFQRRQRHAWANLTHSIIHKRLSDETVLLHVCVTITNVGHVLLSLKRARAWVQQLLPVPEDILDTIERGEDPRPTGDTEIPWPSLDEREVKWEEGKFQIEPGESDEVSFDFLISPAETVTVYTYLTNVSKADEIGWSRTTVYDVQSSKKPGPESRRRVDEQRVPTQTPERRQQSPKATPEKVPEKLTPTPDATPEEAPKQPAAPRQNRPPHRAQVMAEQEKRVEKQRPPRVTPERPLKSTPQRVPPAKPASPPTPAKPAKGD